MGRKIFKRDEIISRLRENIAKKIPIVGAGSSCGLIAKCAEKGGADLIIVYSTGLSRLKGLPTTILGDSNNITISMAEEILNVVQDTPIIAGIQACDPRYWDLDYLIDKFMAVGYSGIINFPTMGFHEPGTLWRELYEAVNLGMGREVELIRTANQKDIFTMAYAFRTDEAVEMAKAGLDCLIVHCGGTAGGMTGFKAVPFEEAGKLVEEMIDAVRKVNPDIICLAHGGPFDVPENLSYLYENTRAQGFVGASSVERIPVEKAVVEAVKGFKNYTIKG
ncbi:phosphoenolpyruvate hydrolase family protein [Candidatus Aerophobetes bacterium]|nr:phosphoenolpyruvate hydrolase family protein [Candidatus Aerophobetes bacterium]